MLREGQTRIPSGCAISGITNRRGQVFSGTDIIDSIAVMRDRSNGLGGGFAVYGVYPQYPDFYAFHIFAEDNATCREIEMFLKKRFSVEQADSIPVNKSVRLENPPQTLRFFLKPRPGQLRESLIAEDDYVLKAVMDINSNIAGAYVFSSGKNMGIFKGVGYPEEIGAYYRLDEYRGHTWTAHGRFPTNTPGWWGGAHPFGLLNWSVVHNGELSSYGANRRYLEMFGYDCALQTDTEVVAYAFDLLVRRHNLPLEMAVAVVAPPLWQEIDRQDRRRQKLLKTLRIVYASLLFNGPFSIILADGQGMMALNDRIKLRPLAAGEKGDFLYVASEEAAIRAICYRPDKIWFPRGGEPVCGFLQAEPAAPVTLAY